MKGCCLLICKQPAKKARDKYEHEKIQKKNCCDDDGFNTGDLVCIAQCGACRNTYNRRKTCIYEYNRQRKQRYSYDFLYGGIRTNI